MGKVLGLTLRIQGQVDQDELQRLDQRCLQEGVGRVEEVVKELGVLHESFKCLEVLTRSPGLDATKRVCVS